MEIHRNIENVYKIRPRVTVIGTALLSWDWGEIRTSRKAGQKERRTFKIFADIDVFDVNQRKTPTNS
jgi:hypothetical protein